MVIELDAPVTTADIENASRRIDGIAVHTPLLHSPFFSRRYGCDVHFKLENLQRTGSFKVRGAYNKVASLTDEQRSRGLIAASSGNHAQGVAYAARLFGIDDRTTIFMPDSTPQNKIENTRGSGQVTVQFVDGNFDAAADAAHEEAGRTGATFIEPYNDWQIIAGQGTIGFEIVHDHPAVDTIIVPVGGGGLISGIALAAHTHNPEIAVYGVGASATTQHSDTVADGIRVKHPGEKPQQVMREHVREVYRLEEDVIREAMRLMLKNLHVVPEGSGATGVAAIESGALQLKPGCSVVIVVSGGNVDLTRLAEILG